MRTSKLVHVLRERFPEVEARPFAEALLLAARKGKVSYSEVGEEGMILLANAERLLVPVRTYRSLAWEDRVLTLKPGEEYEMPTVVRHMVLRAAEAGRWNPDHAVRRYLDEIGEMDRERVLELFHRVLEGSRWTRKISAEQLGDYAREVGLSGVLSRLTAELKGGGIISPCLQASLFSGSLQYEVNPSLYREQRNIRRVSR